jgi:rare lipoprotein A
MVSPSKKRGAGSMPSNKAAATAAVIISVLSCMASEVGAGQIGMASYYKHGRMTASGEKFNPQALTAAHRTLPFGTKVRVVNVRSGKSVIVRINDRGPFVRGRIIDLAFAAARAVGLHRAGVAKVRIDVLK